MRNTADPLANNLTVKSHKPLSNYNPHHSYCDLKVVFTEITEEEMAGPFPYRRLYNCKFLATKPFQLASRKLQQAITAFNHHIIIYLGIALFS